MRKIGVVTVGRSDYGIYLPLLKKIQNDPDLDLCLIASGTHLSPEFGLTVNFIKKDGFKISDSVEMLLSSDTPEGTAKSIGLGVIGFAQSFGRNCPDIIVVLGDRFEMYAAAIAALPLNIPVAHIHGGELTAGAIDDSIRHSITKLSHLHFVSTYEYADRVKQLGEEPWRINVSGALSIENLENISLLSKRELEKKYGLKLDRAPLLVTFHPVTLEKDQVERQTNELLSAFEKSRYTVVFTMPNADAGTSVIRQMIEVFVQSNENAYYIENFGTQDYFSMLAVSAAMVGNSSSGIIEAASFTLPVVNVGSRQDGRIRNANVIDVGYKRDDIRNGIEKAVLPEFRKTIEDTKNVYVHGPASELITSVLKTVKLDDSMIIKTFRDIREMSTGEFHHAN